ncbi:HK97 family phage prohead protease [Thermoactinomyces daqus]|uniref:HK97 family phage prohead protease n=1 Tax=Thermoactinomyces daqus TaxID=1329516 RepID=A0A7W1X8K6_9BACL|nr:HK97 family phage prohead protease [Thermoactinomyces daqus]MBA4541972.1 HK97 family phage prohead protease [Thermoactinomyces daqus]
MGEQAKKETFVEKRFNMLAEFQDVKQADDGYVYIEGYASTFNEDLDGETVAKDAFSETLNDYKLNPVVLANHTNSVESVVGQTVDAKVDEAGLWVRVKLSNSPDPFTSMVREKVKEGTLRAFSIGGLFQYDYPIIKKVKLLEISIVGIPANPYALFSMAKAWKGLEIEERKTVLDTNGDQAEEPGQKELGEPEPFDAIGDPAIEEQVDYRQQAFEELTKTQLEINQILGGL